MRLEACIICRATTIVALMERAHKVRRGAFFQTEALQVVCATALITTQQLAPIVAYQTRIGVLISVPGALLIHFRMRYVCHEAMHCVGGRCNVTQRRSVAFSAEKCREIIIFAKCLLLKRGFQFLSLKDLLRTQF